MSGMTSSVMSTHLVRAELWSGELKQIIEDELMGTNWVRWLDGFPDGDTFTIPSIGQAQVDDYTEGTEILVRPLDTGEFQFSITDYVSSGLSITEKALQDSFYGQQVVSSFLPKESRAIMERFERDVLRAPETGISANSNNSIDGIEHRWAAGGSSGVMTLSDFARAKYVLDKKNIPFQNRIAIVDPSVGFTIDTLTNIVSVANNPMWEGLVTTGMSSGMTFAKNIYGFDVYLSNRLKDVTDSALPDAANNNVDFSSVNGKANLFFSAASDVLPIVGAWRQMPKVDYEYRPSRQEHAYFTTARYGVKMYRPENMVVIPSKTNV